MRSRLQAPYTLRQIIRRNRHRKPCAAGRCLRAPGECGCLVDDLFDIYQAFTGALPAELKRLLDEEKVDALNLDREVIPTKASP